MYFDKPNFQSITIQNVKTYYSKLIKKKKNKIIKVTKNKFISFKYYFSLGIFKHCLHNYVESFIIFFFFIKLSYILLLSDVNIYLYVLSVIYYKMFKKI